MLMYIQVPLTCIYVPVEVLLSFMLSKMISQPVNVRFHMHILRCQIC